MTEAAWGNLALHVGDDVDAVLRRRERLSRALGAASCSWVLGEQIHGARCRKVDISDAGSGEAEQHSALAGLDGLFTQDRQLLLGALFADCVPLLYVVPNHRIVGIAHAGWRGTAATMASSVVRSMGETLGINPKEIEVGIGPSIGSCCYPVGTDTASHFSADVLSERDGRVHLDLVLANTIQLLESGVRETAIYPAGVCTSCNRSFFSYRRDGSKAGRMAALVLRR